MRCRIVGLPNGTPPLDIDATPTCAVDSPHCPALAFCPRCAYATDHPTAVVSCSHPCHAPARQRVLAKLRPRDAREEG